MSHAYAKLKGEPRKICVENLKKSVRQQKSCMSAFTKSDNNHCKVFYHVAYHLGIEGKPYFDGKLVKRCLIYVVKCIYPGKETEYLSIALSHYTIQHCQNDIAKQLAFFCRQKLTKKQVYFYLLSMN